MRNLQTFTDEQAAEIRTMRNLGASWASIGARFNVNPETCRRAVDEPYRLRRAEQIARAKQYRSPERQKPVKAPAPAFIQLTRVTKPPQADVDARLAEIPEDTRDLTGRLMGDPLPGRRALDQAR
jgi:hypothetical protein